jgi:hypothetical protein
MDYYFTASGCMSERIRDIIISPQADACLNVLGIVTKKQAFPQNVITLADIDLPPKLLVYCS